MNRPNNISNFPAKALMSRAGPTVLLFLAAVLLFVIAMLLTVRVQSVSGTEVGVKVNNLTGQLNIITDSGTHIYNGIFNTFHKLDTTVQRMEMSAAQNRGSRHERDDLRIKTVDGSDVYLDVTINYQIDRGLIEEVVTTSGLGDAYKVKWVRDYARSICRTVFGELTTEEFYDSGKRNDKALKAEDELNAELKPFGIHVSKVIAEKFRFHPEYEEKIRAKKLADQEVEEQISRAKAAEQDQIFREVEATKKKEVFIASYAGEMRQLVVEAEAEAEKSVRNAEAYAIEKRLGADASYYQMEQDAKAILARKSAQAEGMRRMSEALTGKGGANLVKLSYAGRIASMSIDGQPFTMDGRTERFSHAEEGAAARPAIRSDR